MEEEFLVVDLLTRAVVPEAEAVLKVAAPMLGARVGGEITKLQLEARTDPCESVEDLHAQLAEGRRVLGDAAAASALAIVASGSGVLGCPIPPPMTEGPRQDRGMATFRGLHDDLAICALHVHVEMPDRERALALSNHLRPYLPVLISLSANSPYWAERDTGYASWRSMTWTRWPVAGPPPYFTSVAHYDALVGALLEAEALVDKGTIFWDIRPSAHQPTLEIRAADVPITAWESALLATLVRALVHILLPAVERGDPGPALTPELLRLAYWRAARDGLSGRGVDVHSGRLVPAKEQARQLFNLVRPVLAEYGDTARVGAWFDRLLAGGDGATRQRAAGGLPQVVDHLIEQTRGRQAT